MKERNLLIAVAALVIVVAVAFALASPRESRFRSGSGNETEALVRDETSDRPRRSATQLCGSSAGFQQLKAAAFQEAIRVRGEPANLQRLAATSVVRMDNPEVTSEDAETGMVTCSGRLVLELPPGAERGFGGQRRLAADVAYTVEPGADGAAATYRLINGDAIVSSLAAFDIDASLQPAEPTETEVAEATPADQLPVIIRPDPADRPAPRAEPARLAPPPARTEREREREKKEDEPAARPTPARPPVARREEPAPRPQRYARPSFDCRSAGSRSERMVCGSERLAAKDREMARYYFRSLEAAGGRERRELERTRNRFLAYRERCATEACIADAYDGRMREIRDIVEAE